MVAQLVESATPEYIALIEAQTDDLLRALWNMNDALLARVQTEEKRRRRAERVALRLWGAVVGLVLVGVWVWIR